MARATVNTADARGVKLPGFTYANVMATIAVFLTLGGGAYAATQLPKDSVGTNQLKAAAVTPAKLSATAKETLTGAPGAAGPAGERGSAGPQGTRGEVGPAGSPDTPLQVLEKVKQVDGEGSGLDAELLDGLSASEFAQSGGASLHEPLSPYDCEENLTPHWIAGPGYFGYLRDQSGSYTSKASQLPAKEQMRSSSTYLPATARNRAPSSSASSTEPSRCASKSSTTATSSCPPPPVKKRSSSTA